MTLTGRVNPPHVNGGSSGSSGKRREQPQPQALKKSNSLPRARTGIGEVERRAGAVPSSRSPRKQGYSLRRSPLRENLDQASCHGAGVVQVQEESDSDAECGPSHYTDTRLQLAGNRPIYSTTDVVCIKKKHGMWSWCALYRNRPLMWLV